MVTRGTTGVHLAVITQAHKIGLQQPLDAAFFAKSPCEPNGDSTGAISFARRIVDIDG